MADCIEDDGRAFPVQVSLGRYIPGLSKREYFAGQIFAAAISNASGPLLGEADLDHLAKLSYFGADALLAHSNNGGSDD